MQVTFPANCTTAADRLAWCYRALEKLRKGHNLMGTWFREGITTVQWDKFPDKIKNRYPYKAQLTAAEWKDFDAVIFRPLFKAIDIALQSARTITLNDNATWSPDLDGDVN